MVEFQKAIQLSKAVVEEDDILFKYSIVTPLKFLFFN